MTHLLEEPISVMLAFNHETRSIMPRKLGWHGREYHVTKVGYHYKVKSGNTLYHIFTVCTENTVFKLALNTDTLHWQLQQIYDESTT